MKNIARLLTVSLLLAFTGCVPSLNPLYTDEDLIFDDSLIGVWVDKQTGETWVFSKRGKLEYMLHHIDEDGGQGEYSAHLVRVEDRTFLDIVPEKPGFSQNEYYQSHFFTTHTFVHIVQKEPTVRISVLEPRWLKDILADNPEAIRHERIGGVILLASSPKETQKFLLANLNTREAFSEPFDLTRKNGVQ